MKYLVLLAFSAVVFTGCATRSGDGSTPGGVVVNVESIKPWAKVGLAILAGTAKLSPEEITALSEAIDNAKGEPKDLCAFGEIVINSERVTGKVKPEQLVTYRAILAALCAVAEEETV